MQKLYYSKGEIIFSQGEITEHLYVVGQGIVAIYRNFGCGKKGVECNENEL